MPMNDETEIACTEWLRALMVDTHGEGEATEDSSGYDLSGETKNKVYQPQEYFEALDRKLPRLLAFHIVQQAQVLGSFHKAWYMISEHDIDLIMTAGASDYMGKTKLNITIKMPKISDLLDRW